MYQQIFPGYLYYPQYQCYLPSAQPCYYPVFPTNQPPKTVFPLQTIETQQSLYQRPQIEEKPKPTKGSLKQESDPITQKQEKTIETSASVSQDQEKSVNLRPNLLVDSTNVQKNFSKAIIQYILRQKNTVFKILGEEKGTQFLTLMNQLVNKLRNLFHIVKYTEDEDFMKAIRILGKNFLRKESICYIYSSKIRQKTSHLKHKTIVKKVLMKL